MLPFVVIVVDSERSEKRSRRSREKRSVQAEVKVKVKEQPVEESADLSKEGNYKQNNVGMCCPVCGKLCCGSVVISVCLEFPSSPVV